MEDLRPPADPTRPAAPGSPVNLPGILDDTNRLVRRAHAVDGHDDEPAGPLEPSGPRQVVEGHRADPAPLGRGDGLDGRAEPGRAPSLDLDERHHAVALAHDVNFSKPGAVSPGNNCVPTPLELAAGQVFAEFSERLPVVVHSHPYDCCTWRATRGRTGRRAPFALYPPPSIQCLGLMKILPAVLASAMPSRRTQVNLALLKRLLTVLAMLMVVYSITFHFLMAHEGQNHSWFTGFYWTIVAMSTLGFGDVTFHTDLGRLFSVIVVLSGMVFMLILLPFTFIQFFYAPWLEARDAARAPRTLPPDTEKHVLLTSWGTIEMVLARRLRQFGTAFAVLVPDVKQALDLHDEGIPVMVGDLDDPETYTHARVERAALVVATSADTTNTNIAATVRECSETVRIVATAASAASVDILELAGCDQVLRLGQLLGRFMARRVFGRDGRTHVIGDIDGLLIAEAAAVNTRLVGQSLRDARLREQHNINVGGVWERGRFRLGEPDTVITSHTVLLLAGTRAQLDDYDADFGVDALAPAYVVIIGGGRVGRAAATALREQGIEHAIVEKIPGRVRDASRVVVGDAADLEVLKEAGIDRASSVIVTTHEDDVNVYLTLYCRRLRPDMLILSRSTLERNTSTLHRAGADFVLSYPSMGAHVIYNMLRESKLLFLAEGLDVFTVAMPAAIGGRTLAETNLRALTGCNVLGIRGSDGAMINANANLPLPERGQLILIGDRDAEQRFLELYRMNG